VAPLIPEDGIGMRWFVNALPMIYNHAILGLGAEAARWYAGMARHPSFQIPGGQARLELGRTALLNGWLDEAAAHLDAAVRHYQAEGMRPFLAQAWLEQARLVLARDEATAAGPLLDRAESLFAALGMTPWVARARALRREARVGVIN
jgi:hypothetical protein